MLAGTILQSGKYTIIQEIGRGGFGVTFKAIHHYLNHEVVMKTINERLRQHPDFPKFHRQFQDEARRLATCVHPHIVRVSDYFEEDGLPYMVMEYIPGETLQTAYILPGIPLPESTAIHYICQIGAALEVVHSQGLLHRDIKPDNIILRQGTQEVVLIDFGIAREFNNGAKQTHTGLVSEGYSPIEQYLTQAPRTAATDVYGLAATLYALLTAEVPTPALLRDRQPMPEPIELQPNLSITVNEAVMQGMAVEPHLRPGNVREWLKLLPKSELKITDANMFTQAVPTINISGNLPERSSKIPENVLPNQKVFKQLGNLQILMGLGVGLLASIIGFSVVKMFPKSESASSPQLNFPASTDSSPIVSPSAEIPVTVNETKRKNPQHSQSENLSTLREKKSRRQRNRILLTPSPTINDNSQETGIYNNSSSSPVPNSEPKKPVENKEKSNDYPSVKPSTEPTISKSSTPEVTSSPSLMDRLRDTKEPERVINTPSSENSGSTNNKPTSNEGNESLPKSTQPENSGNSEVVVPIMPAKPNIPDKNTSENQSSQEQKSLDKSPIMNNNN